MKAKKFSKAADKTNSETKDVFQVVTDRIISLLETGVNPWKKTWTTHKAGEFTGPKSYILVNHTEV